MSSETTPAPDTRHRRRRRVLAYVLIGLLIWAALAYIFVPEFWKLYFRRHPSLDDVPGVTFTADGIPADPINVALIGTKAEVVKIMLAAKWDPADPLTLRSCL